jgi:hypothetical protein
MDRVGVEPTTSANFPRQTSFILSKWTYIERYLRSKSHPLPFVNFRDSLVMIMQGYLVDVAVTSRQFSIFEMTIGEYQSKSQSVIESA